MKSEGVHQEAKKVTACISPYLYKRLERYASQEGKTIDELLSLILNSLCVHNKYTMSTQSGGREPTETEDETEN